MRAVHGRKADALVKRALEIIAYLQPAVWILENPFTGLLPERMEGIQPGLQGYVGDYCTYGAMWRKRTMFWSNIRLKLKTCKGEGRCPSMEGRVHKANCGRSGCLKYNFGYYFTVWEKDAIPEKLVDSLVRKAQRAVLKSAKDSLTMFC